MTCAHTCTHSLPRVLTDSECGWTGRDSRVRVPVGCTVPAAAQKGRHISSIQSACQLIDRGSRASHQGKVSRSRRPCPPRSKWAAGRQEERKQADGKFPKSHSKTEGTRTLSRGAESPPGGQPCSRSPCPGSSGPNSHPLNQFPSQTGNGGLGSEQE